MAQGNIRSPDVSVMRTERLPDGKAPEGFVDGAPHLSSQSASAVGQRRTCCACLTTGASTNW
jgi:hypothetical protein